MTHVGGRQGSVRWRTTLDTRVIGPTAFTLTLLDGFEANVAWDVQRRRGRPDRRPGADIAPMFGVVWPGAQALATLLADDPGLPGARMLELGCGLALPSMVAGRRGAAAIATDCHPDTGVLLEDNLRRNRIEGVTWQRWDWRDPPPTCLADPFDRVIASDVLYDGALAVPLALAFARTLAPHGVGWLTDPGRPWLDAFLDAARAAGLNTYEDLTDLGDDVVHLIRLTRARERDPQPRRGALS